MTLLRKRKKHWETASIFTKSSETCQKKWKGSLNNQKKPRDCQAWEWEKKLCKHVSSSPKANCSLWNRCLYWPRKFYRSLSRYITSAKIPFGSYFKKYWGLSASKIGDDWPILLLVEKIALLLDDGQLYWQRLCSRHNVVTSQTLVKKSQSIKQVTLRSAISECGRKSNNLFSS